MFAMNCEILAGERKSWYGGGPTVILSVNFNYMGCESDGGFWETDMWVDYILNSIECNSKHIWKISNVIFHI